MRRMLAGRAQRFTIALLCAPLLSACTVRVARRTAERDAPGAESAALRLMSFNVRYDNPGDGPDAWPHRRDRVASLIRFHQVDVVGVQEALAPMLTDLDARLPGYGRIGVARTDGRTRGEYSAILYRQDRLTIVDSGTFWLSPTPTVVGSRGWDAALERIATWARFRDRRSGCTYLHLNTHFDHVGEQARRESARLIRQQVATLGRGGPVVVTGDLNSDPTSGAYQTLTTGPVAGGTAALRDGFVASRTPHHGPTSTWTAFKEIEAGRRIDYVLVSPEATVWSHGILTDRWDGRFLSDHLPVLAVVSPCSGAS